VPLFYCCINNLLHLHVNLEGLLIMSRFIKYFRVFFVWLACLVITAHLLIPHDHHLTDSFEANENACPVSDSNTGNHSHHPVHCHAFNDLTSEEARSFIIIKIIHQTLFAISSPDYSFPFKILLSDARIEESRQHFPENHFTEFSHLRAPPVLG
jgi:hypothetical protein